MINCYYVKGKIQLRDYLKGLSLSNSYIYKLLENNAITDEKGYLKAEDIISNSNIYINFSLLETNECYNNLNVNNLSVIFENKDIIAVYKDRGLLIHSDGSNEITLQDYVEKYLYLKGDDSVIRCLHRLDKETTGVVLFSKNVLAHAYITNQMEKGLIEKEYLALVEGVITENGYVDIGIGKNRHDSKKMIAIKSGKSAYTEYKVLKYIKNNTYLSVKIKTGRTHQIRVHMNYINHPIIGDSLYGKGGTLMLMCKRMSFGLFGERINIITKEELV